jgi:hypothetical protein
MVFKDYFWLESKDYAERVSTYTSERLKKQEVVKLRQGISGRWTVGAGLGSAHFTFGASLIASAYGLRRIHLAHKKRKIIEKELTERGIKLHKCNMSDVIIPLCGSLMGMGLAFSFDEIANQATNTAACGATVPSGSFGLKDMMNDPTDASHGVVSGINEQIHEMGLATHDVMVDVIPGSHESAKILAEHTMWNVAPDTAMAGGYHAGMVLAQATEKSLVSSVGAQCAESILDGLDRLKGAVQTISHSGMQKIPTQCEYCNCNHKSDVCDACLSPGKRENKTATVSITTSTSLTAAEMAARAAMSLSSRPSIPTSSATRQKGTARPRFKRLRKYL